MNPARFLQPPGGMSAGALLPVTVISGLAAGLLGRLAPGTLAAAGLAAASLALLMERSTVRRAVLLGGVFLLAAGEGAVVRDRALASPLQIWFHGATSPSVAPEPVHLEGVIAMDASLAESGVRVMIDVDRVGTPDGWRRLAGRVQVHVGGGLGPARFQAWTRGRRIAAPVLLRDPPVWRNPGSPSERWQRLRRPFDLAGTIKSAALVEVRAGAWWQEAGAGIRRRVRDAAQRHVASWSPQSAAIVTAVLIGDRGGLDESVQRRLQAAGTYHVIAISGGNVAILTTLCFLVLRLAVASFRVVAVATIVLVTAYGWLVGGEPSVERAVAAASIYLALQLFGLVPSALRMLGVVAMFVGAADPTLVLDAGAWLSFGATLGIILYALRVMRWATGVEAPARGARGGQPAIGLARRVWRVALGLFCATLAAELLLLPVSVALFARASVLGLVLNFVAIPAMTVVQLAGLAVVALAGWWGAGAGACGAVAHVAASWLVGSSRAVETAPWLVWRVPPGSLVWPVVFYGSLLAAIGLRGGRRWRRLAGLAAAVSLGIILTAPGLALARPREGWLRLTALDVGQGDALAVQFPDGHSLLVDAGGLPGSFDVSERVVTPALWALGIRRLDWLAVTHGDADHIGGALGVERIFRPREIWEGVPVSGQPTLLELRRAAHGLGLGWRQVLAGHRLELGAAVLDVLHPPAPDWERPHVRNDDSLVIRIRLGAVEILLTGDAGREFEDTYAAAPGRLPVRILKVGHHGSRTSSSVHFLRELAPQVALMSVGRGNPFGHPAPEVLGRYVQLGAIVFRTDRDGAITLETDGAAVDISTWSGRHWRIETARN